MITIKATVFESKASRTIEIPKQEKIAKPAIINDKTFGQEGSSLEAFIEKVAAHYKKSLNDDVTVDPTVETGEMFASMDRKALKKAAKTAKYAKLDLINAAIEALPAPEKAPRKEKLSDEEFEAVAEKARLDIGRHVSILKYGKDKTEMTGVIRTIRKDKRTNSVQYTIAITDENGQYTGKSYGKVVGSPELEFTSDPLTAEEIKSLRGKRTAKKEETPAEAEPSGASQA